MILSRKIPQPDRRPHQHPQVGQVGTPRQLRRNLLCPPSSHERTWWPEGRLFSQVFRRTLQLTVFVALAIGRLSATAFQGDPTVPEAGAVQLDNGLIVKGMCSTTNTFYDGEGLLDLGIELRLIDQGYRKVYVATRTSQKAIPNPTDWPVQSFSVPQKRTSSDRLPRAVGPLAFGPFGVDGTATVSVATADSGVQQIRVGIIKINELYAEAIGLTHNWRFSVATQSLPSGILFPGLVERIPKFGTDPFVRLEVARMLIRSKRLDAAAGVLASIQQDFPQAADQIPLIEGDMRSERGRQLLQIFEQRRNAGQYDLALNAGLLFPQLQIAPDVLVQARQLVATAEQTDRRCESLRFRIRDLKGQLSSATLKDRADVILPQLIASIDADTVDRFSAFELLADTDDIQPEGCLALAVSGWLLGAENSIQNLEEAFGLYDARLLLSDYLQTASEESALRSELLTSIVSQEGVSPARMAALILNMPAINPPRLANKLDPQTRRQNVDQSGACPAYSLQLPPEFNPNRRYPLLVAFPREGIPSQDTVGFWSGQADQGGYIIVSPQLYSADAWSYDASAEQHAAFLQFMRTIKLALPIDDERVYAVGHGIGAEAAADMATAHPDLFAGVVSIAGLGRRHLQWTAHNSQSLAWYFVVGEGQGDWFERLRFLLASKLFRRDATTLSIADVLLVLYPNRGFENYFEELPDIFEWMQLHRRTTYPQKLNSSILRSTDRSWSWLELADIPSQFCQLDAPSVWSDAEFRAATLAAEVTRNNGIVITRSPTDKITIKLSPDLPDIDLNKPVTIRSGRERRSVDYSPQIKDMLEELYQTGERQRLCFMKVRLDER